MRTITKIILTAIPLALASSAVSAETFIRMVSGPSGGSWYPYGAKMAEMWGNDVKGITTSNGPGGGVGNVRDVGRGKAQLGWTFGNTAYDGYNGKGKFKKSLKNVRFFANLYPGILQTAVPAKSKIRSYKDLKGKNVSPGKLTFSGNIAVENLLKLYGITYGDIKNAGGTIHRVGYKDSVALMKDGHIDAFVGLTTAPNSSYIALDFSPGIRFLSVDANIADKYVKTYPGFIKTTLRKGTYKGVTADVPTIASPTVLIINKSVSSDVAYKLAKVLWDNHADLAKVIRYWNNVSLKESATGAAIPLHPGALRYYREKGVAK
ncbi:MAG: TAXI family TRAP transporter solute-binding subunit [Alphaproteobacteria bacterium]